ncbi:hypothetical protein Brsp05_02727 [Brucella sp. NBRC 12953]|uniref:hypothetical protein n=1 Tax=Brucella sp. NBRC 12953 TaxID=3075481 RepID=UPI000DE42E74
MSKGKKHPGNRPDRRQYPLHDISIEHLVGSLVIAWNNAENSSKLLLNRLLGSPPGIQAVTNELNGQSLWFALKAASSQSVHTEIEEHVRQISIALERLNEHRNYFVHGSLNKEGEHLVLRTEYAKGEVREYEDRFDKQEIHQLVRDCDDIGMCAIDITAYLMLKKMDRASSLPDTPFLPPQLDKTRRNPKAHAPKPSSSPE